MTARLIGVLIRYGRDVTVLHGETETAGKAFLQLLSAAETAPYQVTPLGAADDRRWLLLADVALADGDVVRCGGADYEVCAAAPVYLGREFSHWRGVLEKRRETA